MHNYKFKLRQQAAGQETLKLIALWSEDSTQTMLEGCKRTKVVFSKLAKPNGNSWNSIESRTTSN